jgi:hypothetical protein
MVYPPQIQEGPWIESSNSARWNSDFIYSKSPYTNIMFMVGIPGFKMELWVLRARNSKSSAYNLPQKLCFQLPIATALSQKGSVISCCINLINDTKSVHTTVFIWFINFFGLLHYMFQSENGPLSGGLILRILLTETVLLL